MGALHIASIYVTIHVAVAKLVRLAMEEVNALAREPVIAMGDFNARHTDWCFRSNSRGQKLSEWTLEEGKSVLPPDSPTFKSRNGRKSTINLIVYRACGSLGARLPEGTCSGASDHRSIVTEVRVSGVGSARDERRISKAARLNERICEEVKDWFRLKLPGLVAAMNTVQDATELQRQYDAEMGVMLKTWGRANRRPKSRNYRFFWTEELERTARRRTRLYKKDMRTEL